MKLLISFSGGRTSAFMTKYLLENMRDKYSDIVVVFANTGCEDDRTLEFIHRCDAYFNFNTVWIEPAINPKLGQGTKHTIVDFNTADRKGDNFEKMIIKYGLPNRAFPMCTDRLKLAPITSYIRSIGWKSKTYDSAIGIRVDEMDRVSKNMVRDRLIYPLVEDCKMTKEGIRQWWNKQPFDLDIKEHEGNCLWCYKKSKRKLLTLMRERPDVFDFPERMEKYKSNRGDERQIFRGKQTVNDLRNDSIKDFKLFEDVDLPNGCSESCEAVPNQT